MSGRRGLQRSRGLAVSRAREGGLVESGRCGGGERGVEGKGGGGVVEGGGGLENAPYRSAPRGPPIIGSAWRRAARAPSLCKSLSEVCHARTGSTENAEYVRTRRRTMAIRELLREKMKTKKKRCAN